MNSIYHWLGFLVFWGAIALFLYLLGIFLWERWNGAGRVANYWLWFKVFVLRSPLYLTKSKSYWLVHYAKNHKWKMQVPRNIIARCIRYSRQRGYKPEEE